MKKYILFLFILCCIKSYAQNITKDSTKITDTDQSYNDTLYAKGYTDSLVYNSCEIPARFLKGDIVAYIKDNLLFPKAFKNQKISVLVLVKCIIEKNGDISFVRFLTDNPIEFQDASRKVISSMTRWQPAQQGLKPLRSYMTLSFVFNND